MADATCSTSVDNTLQEHEHLISTLGADDLVHARLELHDEIALVVLDARDEHRCRADAVIGKCGVGADHLSNRHFARSEAERHRGMDIRIVDAIFVQQVDKLLRIELTHQIGGYPVVRLRQSPLQRDHLSVAAAGGVARCPRLAGNDVGALHVGCIVARRKTVLHCERIEIGLDGGAHLAAPRHHHVVHEVCEIETTDVSFHMTGLRVHAHEARTQERLVVANGVHRRHYRVLIATIAEHGHIDLLVERLANLLVGSAGSLHGTITLTLLHRPIENLAHLCRREFAGERCIGLGSHALIERRLQELHHVLIDSLFGILLHARIDGGVDLQTVSVEVIRFAVLAMVLVAPAIERVGLPGDGVDDILILVPRGIVVDGRTLRHHVATQELAEVRGGAVFMVGAMEVEDERFVARLLAFSLREIARLLHLREHDVATVATALGIAHRVEQRRVLAKTDERRRLLNVQFARLLIKIGVGSRLDAHGVMQEVEVVQIEGDDFLLRVVALQLHGNHPLDGFLQQALELRVGSL